MANALADISPQRRAELNAGAEARTLTECLAVDFAALMRVVVPEMPERLLEPLRAALAEGITRRMALAAEALAAHFGPALPPALARHSSDTVRGWACYVIAQDATRDDDDCVEALLPYADDPHFGVREWVWLALRPRTLAGPQTMIARLTPLTASPSERLRRFASEATRPRGVWCKHITLLRASPELGLPIIAPLRADASRYVQDSVANWLNDAGKDRPDWLRALCADWGQGPDTSALRYVLKRATRSLSAQEPR